MTTVAQRAAGVARADWSESFRCGADGRRRPWRRRGRHQPLRLRRRRDVARASVIDVVSMTCLTRMSVSAAVFATIRHYLHRADATV